MRRGRKIKRTRRTIRMRSRRRGRMILRMRMGIRRGRGGVEE